MLTLDNFTLPFPSVSSLGHTPCPAAVTCFIIAIIVYSVQACIWGPGSHVLEKLLKIISPFRANGNTPATVIEPSMMVLVTASFDHVRPTSIFRPAIFAESAAMLKIAFLLQAAAAFRGLLAIFSHYEFNTNNLFFSVIAPTKPKSAPRIIYSFNSRQSVEFLAGNVFKGIWHIRSIA